MNKRRRTKIKFFTTSILLLALYICQNVSLKREQFALLQLFPYKSASYVCTAARSNASIWQVEPVLSYINQLPADEYGKVVEKYYLEDLKDIPKNLKKMYSYESVNRLENNFIIELQLDSSHYNFEFANNKFQLFKQRIEESEIRAYSDAKIVCDKGLRLMSNSLDNYIVKRFRYVDGLDAVETAIVLIYLAFLALTMALL